MSLIVLTSFGNLRNSQLAINAALSIRMNDANHNLILVGDKENIENLDIFQCSLFYSIHMLENIKDVNTFISTLTLNILLLPHDILFFNNKPITWLFNDFKNEKMVFMDKDISEDVNYGYYSLDSLNDLKEFSSFKENNRFFCYSEERMNNVEIFQKYYCIKYTQGVESKKIYNKLLEIYQSKIFKIDKYKNLQLLKPNLLIEKYELKQNNISKQSNGFNLLIEYYKVNDEERNKEILTCLKKNLDNSLIKNIIVFLEKDVPFPIVNPKITKVITLNRMKYSDFLSWSNDNIDNDICIISNNDIYFDSTLSKISIDLTGKFACLTRYDVDKHGNKKFYNNKRSSDVWIYKTPVPIFGNFYLGIPHCDGRIMWEAEKIGKLEITNPSLGIISYHLHNEENRTWRWGLDYIIGEVYDLDFTHDITIPSKKIESYNSYNLVDNLEIDRNFLKSLYVEKFGKFKNDGTFIYVGSGDGLTNSPVSCFAASNWNGILIEPSLRLYQKAVKNYKNYPNIKIVQDVIDSKEKENNFIDNDQFSSLDENSLNYKNIDKIPNIKKVITKKLDSILSLYEYAKIDVLVIDTNGTEGDVLNSIDLDKYKPEILIIKYIENNLKSNVINHSKINTIIRHNRNYNLVWENKDYKVYSFNIENENLIKINLIDQIRYDSHRSGWGYALDSIKPMHGINNLEFDGFIEHTFLWNYEKNLLSNKIPYMKPWVGFIHLPPTMAPWYNNGHSLEKLLLNHTFRESLKTCKCIFVLSDHLKKWLETKISIPIKVVFHPTEDVNNKWTIEKFDSQINKRLVQVGFWLRNLTSIYRVKSNNLNKCLLLANNQTMNFLTVEVIYRQDKFGEKIDIYNSNVTILDRLNNDEYDELLSSSIVFLDLYDTSCNNVIIECIVRNTPIILNYHPATVEYLGEDYPLYFNNLDEVEDMLKDYDLVIKAHEYLKNIDKIKFTSSYFLNEIKNTLFNIVKKSKFLDITVTEKLLLEGSQLGDDSKGGIYNPGVVYKDNKIYVLPRVEKFTERERGHNGMVINTSSIPYILTYDSNFNLLNLNKYSIDERYVNKRIEDFRLFEHNNLIYSNHILLENKISPVISLVDIDNKQLQFISKLDLDFQTRNVEKNWVFFSMNNDLYMIYSIEPWIVLKVDLKNNKAETIVNKSYDLKWSIEGYLSISTNPIKIHDNLWLMGIHTRDRNLIYYQGFLIFNNEFEILKISKTPILSGGVRTTEDFRINDKVMYTSSIINIKNKIYLFSGEGDYNTVYHEIDILDILIHLNIF